VSPTADVISRWFLALGLVLGLNLGGALGHSFACATKPDGPAKVSPALLALHDAYREAQRSGTSFRADNPLVRIVDDRVVIDAAASGEARVLEADLIRLGLRRVAVFGRLVSGELPIAAIPALDSLSSLAFARESTAGLRRGSGPSPRSP
jgi:hypothetical protein